MSNMVVNTNVLALNSHRSLKGVGTMQAKASARLSSGLKINSAADDAAGLAISEKMRAQIRGLDMASKNSQDAISLIQTAEGGMQEIDNMIQRIRELTVQASNDTNDFKSDDRQKMQDEVNDLVKEIDSMSERTEFNKKKVINGDYTARTTTVVDNATINADANVVAKKATLDAAILAGTDAVADFNDAETKLTAAKAAHTLATAGVPDLATATADFQAQLDLYDALVAAYDAELVVKDVKLAATGAVVSDTSSDIITATSDATDWDDTAKDATARKSAYDDIITAIETTSMASATFLGKDLTDDYTIDLSGDLATIKAPFDTLFASKGWTNAKTNFEAAIAGGGIPEALALADAQEYYAAKDTAQTSFVAATAAAQTAYDSELATVTAANTSSVTSGGLYFQVGANTEQGWTMSIGSVLSDTLGIGDGEGKASINLLFETGADITKTLDTIDKALSYVTSERSKLGAAQNRLEYTIKSLDISSENLSAAESRIRDTDMAKEMMNLTKANVLQQAATSMLAQANQAPQNVLQLLQ